MASPAERYADARRRQATASSHLASFAALYPFGLDPFQVRACEALEAGDGVLVAAPTGAGKTVVGEFAVHLALAEGRKCFYTTPIKALSNQKYADLVDRYGADKVGLLTGDNSVNGEAPVVVMTTEVLRNMLYAGSRHPRRPRLRRDGRGALPLRPVPRRGLGGGDHPPARVGAPGVAVGDGEQRRGVRRLAGHRARRHRGDRRGAPAGAAVAARDGRRPAVRPVRRGPQRQGRHRQGQPRAGAAGPRAGPVRPGRPRSDRRRGGRRPRAGARRRAGSTCSSGSTPRGCCPRSRSSSAGPAATPPCSSACTPGCGCSRPRSGPRSAPSSRRGAPTSRDEDLHVLGYYEWLDGLERGIAAHHAGMLPTFKEVVEELFVRGLVKAVFATETLALGINMPARSVVLERLVKWNGETHADITPGEYTQLTGRAGRRGIDVEGHAVVSGQPGLDPAALAGLASTRTYPLRSSFRPSYNMAVNLVGQVGRDRARELLRVVVRPVPGRPGGGRAGPAGAPQRGGARGLPRGDDLPPRRLRGVRRAAPAPSPTARRSCRAAARRNRRAAAAAVAGGAAARRRHPGAGRPPGRPGGRARPRRDGRRGRAAAHGAHRRAAGPPALAGRLPGAGRGRWTGCGSRRPSTRATRPSRRDLASTLRDTGARPTGRRAGPVAPGPRPPTTPSCSSCGPSCGRTPATAAPSARTTPAGPSATTGCAATPTSWRAGSRERTHTIARTFDRVCALLDELGYLRRRRGDPDRPARSAGSTPSSTC